MQAAEVKLSARLFGDWVAVSFGRGRYPFLFTYNSFDAFSKLFQRIALLDQFKNRSEQRFGHVQVFHSPRSFRKRFYLCLTNTLYTQRVYNSIDGTDKMIVLFSRI